MNYFKSKIKYTAGLPALTKVREQAGFTLIETLVALSIFTTSILAIMSVTPGGISAVDLSKNKTTASYLAQEGLDLVRAYRDTAKINGVSATATAFATLTATCTTACYIDPVLITPTICIDITGDGVPDCPLLTHDVTGGFSYAIGGSASQFTRTISVNQSAINTGEYIVISKVLWGANNSVSYQSSLTDWQ